VLHGTVIRSAYLGENRDLLIEADNFAFIRATVRASREFVAGQKVTMHLPVEKCLVVNSSDT
jgi:iron(III) transport system ATP-binding protein